MRRFPLTVRFLRLKKKSWMFAPLAVFTAVVLGATDFHFIEDLSWLDSFYMAAQTVTTVGYGDLPVKTVGKIFDIVFMLTGGTVLFALTVRCKQSCRLIELAR